MRSCCSAAARTVDAMTGTHFPLKMEHELDCAGWLAVQAGRRILEHRRGTLEVGHKAHGEVVTAADRESDHIIRTGLAAAFPDDAVYSEETADSPLRLARLRVWIVDPLDGTSDFVAGGDEFTVSIGLAIGGVPVVGVVYNPTREELFAGGLGMGTRRNGVTAGVSRESDVGRARVSVSRKEHARLAGMLPELALSPITSMSYKLARVSAGLDDAALSWKRRKEWGSCAGVALVRAAGGRVTLLDGSEVMFNRAQPTQPMGMLAAGSRLHAPLVRRLQQTQEAP